LPTCSTRLQNQFATLLEQAVRPVALSAIALLLAACTTTSTRPNTLTGEEIKQGWRLLFDGTSTYGWHNYGAEPDKPVYGWAAVNGTLVPTAANAGDLVTNAEFENFELSLEWRAEPGGDSGIYIRATEGAPFIFMSAPEMQLRDDTGHPEGQNPLTSAGASFGLYPAPPGLAKSAGEWNSARLRIEGNSVTQWLNGQRILGYEIGNADWQARVAASSFRDWPGFGQAARGHVGLQDHGGSVAFRNIKILRLPEGV
jgi:hypothetical protein